MLLEFQIYPGNFGNFKIIFQYPVVLWVMNLQMTDFGILSPIHICVSICGMYIDTEYLDVFLYIDTEFALLFKTFTLSNLTMTLL